MTNRHQGQLKNLNICTPLPCSKLSCTSHGTLSRLVNVTKTIQFIWKNIKSVWHTTTFFPFSLTTTGDTSKHFSGLLTIGFLCEMHPRLLLFYPQILQQKWKNSYKVSFKHLTSRILVVLLIILNSMIALNLNIKKGMWLRFSALCICWFSDIKY